jgi:2-hydroxychromene-2-carboxylate isomerase
MRLPAVILPAASSSWSRGARKRLAQLTRRTDREVEFQPGLFGVVIDHPGNDAAYGAGSNNVDFGCTGG